MLTGISVYIFMMQFYYNNSFIIFFLTAYIFNTDLTLCTIVKMNNNVTFKLSTVKQLNFCDKFLPYNIRIPYVFYKSDLNAP